VIQNIDVLNGPFFIATEFVDPDVHGNTFGILGSLQRYPPYWGQKCSQKGNSSNYKNDLWQISHNSRIKTIRKCRHHYASAMVPLMATTIKL
jgi:hypothetical protein